MGTVPDTMGVFSDVEVWVTLLQLEYIDNAKPGSSEHPA